MVRYLNMKTSYGVETVDSLDTSDFATNKEFRAELRRLISEYHLCGMNVYSSQRATHDYNN